MTDTQSNLDDVALKTVLEAVLLCAQQPLSLSDLRQMMAEAVTEMELQQALQALAIAWQDRGLALQEVATGWRFQTRPLLAPYLARLYPEKPPRYTRATLETLAIIAWRQPCTRGDIEDIRGVAVNSTILKALEDRGWIETIGHRETIGRPALLATTQQFLDDLGLRSLQDLPSIASLTGDLGTHLAPQLAAALADNLQAQASLTGLETPADSHSPPDIHPEDAPQADDAASPTHSTLDGAQA